MKKCYAGSITEALTAKKQKTQMVAMLASHCVQYELVGCAPHTFTCRWRERPRIAGKMPATLMKGAET
ncbi:hypothetical protein ACFL5Z_16775 [Planctomycetota bacterium]